MKTSRIAAVGLVAAAGLWIASGHFMPHESGHSRASVRSDGAAKKLFRVAVVEVKVVDHARKLVLAGRTEADRRVVVTARSGGVLTEVRVRRGARVKEGDIIAVLSDDARKAQVAQAESLVTQRRTELEAKRKLIASGAVPKLELVNLEAQLAAAEATLAAAQAELERGFVRAPFTGIVNDITAEVGGSSLPMMGREIGTVVALDPMLAVVEVSERRLAGLRQGEVAEVKLITGERVTGKIRFVAKTASQTTRTYRVEVELANPDSSIPDGISAEVAIPVAATPAARLPRSALTIASTGDIGVRTVDADGVVAFNRVNIVEDEQSFMWVAGLRDGARVIVRGQDFVREGQTVEAVAAAEVTATAK
ncbi:MAG TPA: efflux RND transporter periplasmic adaptor subunit [Xanthobacteraceae bacterium]|nr:efflux RND transporter periplasmic adaptor subunit [Xanthobacteraceae bacterium]